MRKAITCPDCGTVNTIRGSRVPEETPVNCSACEAPLGSWQAAPVGDESEIGDGDAHEARRRKLRALGKLPQ